MDHTRKLMPAAEAHSARLMLFGVPVLVIVGMLSWLTVLSASNGSVMVVARSSVFSASLAAASLLVALVACYVSLTEFVLYGSLFSLYLGLAFSAMSGGYVGLRLLPLIAGWHNAYSWILLPTGVEDFASAALLFAAGMMATRSVPVVHRTRSLLIGLAAVCVVEVALSAWAYRVSTAIPGTTDQSVLVAAGCAFLLATLAFWRSSRQTGRSWFFWLSLCLLLAAFADFQYAIHSYRSEVVHTGDVLRLGSLCALLFALAAEWSDNYRRLRWQARELRALHALESAPSPRDLAALVYHIEEIASTTFGADARIHIADRVDGERDSLAAQLLHMSSSPQEDTEGRPAVVVGFDDSGGQVAMGVALQTQTRRLGLLVVARPAGQAFSPHDLRLLRAFGPQATALLERGILYEEIAAGAVMGERNRLGREIHDGIAQQLAFLKMQVGWLRRTPERVDAPQLERIEKGLEMALIEARHAIATLRAEPSDASTGEMIAAYLEEFGQVSGLNVEIDRSDGLPEVAATARVELLRIVQEALNNVRKHALADNVRVSICPDTSGVRIDIRDNGSGFETGQDLEGHFGLSIMRERAESVGGTLEIESAVGEGTCLHVWIPASDTTSGFAQRLLGR